MTMLQVPPETTTTRAGKPLPTSTRGQRTRQALVDSATRLFSERAYGEVTAAAITAEAGVSYGSFYVYFADVRGLFVEVAQSLMAEVWLETRAPMGISDPAQRLVEENHRYFALYRERSQLFILIEALARTDADFRAVWQELRDRYTARFAASIRKLQRSGRVDATLDPTATAVLLGGMAERAAYVTTLTGGRDEQQLERTMSALWLRALGLERALPFRRIADE